MWSASVKLLPDSRLSRMAARGDARAFELIFERHHQELYRYCRAILADPDDAQDALQSTMMAALRALPGERRDIPLRPWLFRVAHNEAISIARARRPDEAADGPEPTAPGADVTAESRERIRTLVADLGALSERQRGAIVMRELNDLSYSDIGGALGTSEAAARQLVYEAREAMRELTAARDTDCAEIRELISGRDGRVLRGRRVRAHLRTCEGCQDFMAAIAARSADLQALAPAMPAIAGTALLAGLIGEAGTAGLAGGVASGAGAGALGAAGGAAGIAKTGAVVAAIVVGAGGGVTAALDLRDGALNDPEPKVSTLAPGPADGEAPSVQPASSSPRGGQAHGGSAHPGNSSANENADAHGHGNANGHANAPGQSQQPGSQGQGLPAGGSDGVTGPPAQANGNGPPVSAGTGTGNAGGNSSTSNGVSAAPPRSESGAAHSNAGAGGAPEHANGQGKPTD